MQQETERNPKSAALTQVSHLEAVSFERREPFWRKTWYVAVLELAVTIGLTLLVEASKVRFFTSVLFVLLVGFIARYFFWREGYDFPTTRLSNHVHVPIKTNQPLPNLPDVVNLSVLPVKKGELNVWFDPATDVENDIVVMMPPKSRRTVRAKVLSVRKAEPLVVYEPSDLDD